MSDFITADFLKGKKLDHQQVPVAEVLDFLESQKEKLVDWPIERLVEIVDCFSGRILERSHDIHRNYPNSGIPFIASFCRKRNLEGMLSTAFFNPAKLDQFVDSQTQTNRAYRLYPKGIIVHWLAGNVPTLGFLSLIQGILTKNANLLKVSSASNDMLPAFLEIISGIKPGEEMSGADLCSTIAVVRYDRSNREIGRQISKHSDVRIFWGSDEAVNTLKSISAKLGTTDVVFPNKTSLILIGKGAFDFFDIEKATSRIATDISVFEQKACASPHTIFIETNDDKDISEFAKHLSKALEVALKSLPKLTPSQTEVSAILNLRAEYDIFYDAWYSEGTEFTILHDDRFQLGPPIGNRTVYLRKCENLEKVADLITPQVQSIGILTAKEEFDRISNLLGAKGVQRFTNLGTMTHFETPWDGYNLLQYLVRWTSRPTA